ncbi:MFS transporter [Streptomyces sp. NPDC008121]|uniref:MFS transporter n=1 Tax=Streptomyces sp. NPDC008121 TaxID=3364809 RepID=UPI0036E246C1
MTARRHVALACSVLGAAVVALDGTVLTIAQPALQHDLRADVDQVQWTSTGYLIAVASLLVFAGRLGDRYGHRRLFALGTLGFAVTSACVAYAPGIGWVTGLRVAQGVCGALLQPATLGMLRAAFPADRLAMPIALRTSAIGLAAAAGPLVGGALVSAYGWRSVFLLTAVPALAVGVLAVAVPLPDVSKALRSSRPPRDLDLPGACLLAIALACLVHALVAVAEPGRPSRTIPLALAAALVAGAALVRRERRTPRPLLPPDVLRSAPVLAGLGALLAASAALFGTLFVTTYFLQDTLGLDPLESALWVLPLAVTMVLGAPVAALLTRRFGARRTTVSGAGLLTLGVLLLSRLGDEATALAAGGCFALVGAGFSTVMVTATAVLVHRADVADAGVAGGLQQTAMNVGPAFGVAAATLLMTVTPAGAPTGGSTTGLLALAALAALGAAAALGLPGRAPSPAPDEQPAPTAITPPHPAPPTEAAQPHPAPPPPTVHRP